MTALNLVVPEFLNDVNAKSMEHLADGRHLTLEKNGHGPSVVVRHVVEEPAARRC